jgi:Ca2+-binding EF-hand superfamily protein
MLSAQINPIFEEEDLRTMFAMFDVKSSGYINLSQYKQAMQNLGIRTFEPRPEGTIQGDKLTLARFVECVHAELKANSLKLF